MMSQFYFLFSKETVILEGTSQPHVSKFFFKKKHTLVDVKYQKRLNFLKSSSNVMEQ